SDHGVAAVLPRREQPMTPSKPLDWTQWKQFSRCPRHQAEMLPSTFLMECPTTVLQHAREKEHTMTRIFSSLAGHDADRVDATAGKARLPSAFSTLVYSAVRPLLCQMHYHKVADDLSRLADEVLGDVGIARQDIGTHASTCAASRWPARGSFWAALAD